jgi:hypothetical protein
VDGQRYATNRNAVAVDHLARERCASLHRYFEGLIGEVRIEGELLGNETRNERNRAPVTPSNDWKFKVARGIGLGRASGVFDAANLFGVEDNLSCNASTIGASKLAVHRDSGL